MLMKETGQSAHLLPANDASALAGIQFDLYAHIVVLMGRTEDARDVLQETNLKILEELRTRHDIRNFLAWAKTLAYYEVLRWRKSQQRDRLVFDDELINSLGERLSERPAEAHERLEALDACLSQLTPGQRDYIEERYSRGARVKTMSERYRCSVFAMATLLYRIRLQLLKCVERRLGREASA